MRSTRTPLAALAALLLLPVVGVIGPSTAPVASPAATADPAAPADPPGVTVHWTEPDAIGTAATTTTSTATYRFSSYVGGKPVRWDPCRTIYWQFRTTGAPTGARTVVRSVVGRVALLTGTRWVEKPATTATPTSAWLPKSSSGVRPVLIGWTDAAHSDLLRNRPSSVLGVTRTAYFGATINGVQKAATKAAVVALDRTDRLPLTGVVSWRSVLLHELGHGMGLDHVGTTSQLMYPVLGHSLRDFQSGDRTGLYKLGRSAGCINLGF